MRRAGPFRLSSGRTGRHQALRCPGWEIKGAQALQWTCGAGSRFGSPPVPDLLDRAREAGKALHLSISEGAYDDWVRACDTLVNRYGADGLYFLLPVMSEAEAERFIAYADTHWQKASC